MRLRRVAACSRYTRPVFVVPSESQSRASLLQRDEEAAQRSSGLVVQLIPALELDLKCELSAQRTVLAALAP